MLKIRKRVTIRVVGAVFFFVFLCPSGDTVFAQEIGLPQLRTVETNSSKQIAKHIRDGSAAYKASRYSESVEHYAMAFALGHDRPKTAYNAACSAALAEMKDSAFGYLDFAIDLGWIDSQRLEKDADLETLWNDRRWKLLVSRMSNEKRKVESRWRSGAFRTKFEENISDSEKVAGLSKIWSEAKYNFVHFDQVPDLDWDATFLETIPKVLQTKSTFEYYQELSRMFAKLNDGHTNIYLPSQLASMEACPGIETRLVENKVIVMQVFDKSAVEAGLRVGMEILRVGELNVKDHVANHVAPFVCASTIQDRQRQAFGRHLFKGPLSQSVDLQVVDADGKIKEIQIARQPAMWSRMRRFSTAKIEFQILDGNVGYLKLNSFASQAVTAQFIKVLPEIFETDSMIIDLRKNGGGNSGVGWEIFTYFTDEPFETVRWHTLQYRPTMRPWGRQPMTRYSHGADLFNRKKDTTYDKPVVMLIGPATFSAAEDMVAVFLQTQRGKTIGQATGGSTGQPLSFDLPGGGKARVCTKHDFYANGTEFVGIGIQPDISVGDSIADIRRGVDTVLQAAIEELKLNKK